MILLEPNQRLMTLKKQRIGRVQSLGNFLMTVLFLGTMSVWTHKKLTDLHMEHGVFRVRPHTAKTYLSPCFGLNCVLTPKIRVSPTPSTSEWNYVGDEAVKRRSLRWILIQRDRCPSL